MRGIPKQAYPLEPLAWFTLKELLGLLSTGLHICGLLYSWIPGHACCDIHVVLICVPGYSRPSPTHHVSISVPHWQSHTCVSGCV